MLDLAGLAAKAPASAALSKSVTDVLRDMIVRGSFAPGDHLKEAALADVLGVSRGPVREALAQLEGESFVELRRNRGAFVVELTRQDIEEVYTLRVALERLAIERAATHAGPELFGNLDAVLGQMRLAGESVPANEAVDLDLAFHDVIFAAADHARLRRSWEFIRSQVAFFLHERNVQFPDFPEVGLKEHQAIRDVLASGDARAAVDAIEQHVLGTYVRLMKEGPAMPTSRSKTR